MKMESGHVMVWLLKVAHVKQYFNKHELIIP